MEELTESVSSKPHVAIVGVGGAGNNLLTHAIEEGLSPKNCVAVNTDREQLSESRAQSKVLLGHSFGDVQNHNGHQWDGAESIAQRVAPLTRLSDLTILLAGLGGITGTNATPAIAQLNRGRVKPVVSVVALPFIHERERRFVALRGLKRLVESCDVTVVVDNAIEFRPVSMSERRSDEIACLAVKGLSDLIGTVGPATTRRILAVLRLGQVATTCVAPVRSRDKIQSAVIDALHTPSARLPPAKARGAVVLFRGMGQLNDGQGAMVYDAIASFVGHDLEFAYASTAPDADPSLVLLLTGYSYGMTLGAFADLITDVYDMEYGMESGPSVFGVPLRLYQMETY